MPILISSHSNSGAPGKIRTLSLQIRSLTLYPVELRAPSPHIVPNFHYNFKRFSFLESVEYGHCMQARILQSFMFSVSISSRHFFANSSMSAIGENNDHFKLKARPDGHLMYPKARCTLQWYNAWIMDDYSKTLVPWEGIEPSTSPLPRECSTSKLLWQRHFQFTTNQYFFPNRCLSRDRRI